MKNTLIIIRGIPGSGKSTAAEILANVGICPECNVETTYPICTADDFFMKNGEYKFNAKQLGFAHASCQKKVENAMINDSEKIFVANTNTTDKELSTYYNLAEKHGYMVISLIVENRHNGTNVHNVPEEAITRMIDRFSIKL